MRGLTAFLAFAAFAAVSVSVSALRVSCTCSGTATDCDAGGVACQQAQGTGGNCMPGAAGATCFSDRSGSCADVTQQENLIAQQRCDIVCSAVQGASVSGTVSCQDDSSPKCFPANATVQLENGATKRMIDLVAGDKVLALPGHFSSVYMFSHKLSNVRAEFVQISTAGGRTISLTGNHYLYVNGKLAVASVVKTGDELTTAAGKPDRVVGVSSVWADGLYNPHTMHGDIVVDGIHTSTYTSDIDPTLAHAALWPVRMLYSTGRDVIGDAFAAGSDLIASVLPDGKQQY